MSLTPEGIRKLEEMKAIAVRQYERISALPDAVELESFDSSKHTGEFMQLPYRPLMGIDSFNDPTVIMDLVFGEIGRGLAFSETRLIAERLTKSSAIPSTPRTPLLGILESVASLRSSGFNPTSVFAPVNSYVDWYDDLMTYAPPPPFRITKEEEKSYLVFPDGRALRWIWSNKLSPFDDFFVLDKKWAHWISKPNVSHRLEITEKTVGSKLDIIFRVVFKFDVKEESAVRRFTPLKPRRS